MDYSYYYMYRLDYEGLCFFEVFCVVEDKKDFGDSRVVFFREVFGSI